MAPVLGEGHDQGWVRLMGGGGGFKAGAANQPLKAGLKCDCSMLRGSDSDAVLVRWGLRSRYQFRKTSSRRRHTSAPDNLSRRNKMNQLTPCLLSMRSARARFLKLHRGERKGRKAKFARLSEAASSSIFISFNLSTEIVTSKHVFVIGLNIIVMTIVQGVSSYNFHIPQSVINKQL